jgi:hypothetical protein
MEGVHHQSRVFAFSSHLRQSLITQREYKGCRVSLEQWDWCARRASAVYAVWCMIDHMACDQHNRFTDSRRRLNRREL